MDWKLFVFGNNSTVYTEQKSVLLMADSSLSLMSQCKARFLQVFLQVQFELLLPLR